MNETVSIVVGVEHIRTVIAWNWEWDGKIRGRLREGETWLISPLVFQLHFVPVVLLCLYLSFLFPSTGNKAFGETAVFPCLFLSDCLSLLFRPLSLLPLAYSYWFSLSLFLLRILSLRLRLLRIFFLTFRPGGRLVLCLFFSSLLFKKFPLLILDFHFLDWIWDVSFTRER